MLRRHFLHQSAAAAAASSLAPAVHAATKAGPRRFRTVLIGCGWWGNNILREAMASGECEIVGLCDVDSRQFAATQRNVAAGTGDQPREFKDYRELLAATKPEIAITSG